jgi:hypothetical protein
MLGDCQVTGVSPVIAWEAFPVVHAGALRRCSWRGIALTGSAQGFHDRFSFLLAPSGTALKAVSDHGIPIRVMPSQAWFAGVETGRSGFNGGFLGCRHLH